MIERRPLLDFITHAVLLVGVLLTGFPLWVALVASTHAPTALSQSPIPLWFGDQLLENYSSLLTGGLPAAGGIPVGAMLVNSLVMALTVAFGKLVISVLSAYAIVFFRFPFRMTAFWLIFMTLMLPVEVRVLPTFEVVARLDLLDSYAGLTVPLMASATATFLFRQYFLTIPDQLVEAARLDGAGPLRFLWDFVLPLSRTNIAALFVVLFVYGWNQYLWPMLITTDESFYTVVMGIRRMVNAGEAVPVWHHIMGTATLAMLPPVLVVLIMRRQFVKGLVQTEK